MVRKEQIQIFVHRKIEWLKAESNSGEGKALFAKLRHGIGKNPADDPKIIGVILQDMPEEFFSRDGKTTKAEWASYIALTLFALHQQGKSIDSECMNSDDRTSIGLAMNRLAMKQDDANSKLRMQQKYKSLSTSIDMKAMSIYLRGLVSILKAHSISLDYALLASDLYEFQSERTKSNVILRWGQDLYRIEKNEEDDDNE